LKRIEELKVQIFADGADQKTMLKMYEDPLIKGLTTNPTLMKKAGISNYREFCLDILKTIKNKPISFEVFSDDFHEMEKQALEIASWGENVFVKIPITNTQKNSSYDLIKRLVGQGVKVNVTAIMTLPQISGLIEVLNPNIESYVSVFAGRVADTGVDPIPLMSKAVDLLRSLPQSQLIWASPRELLNILQADSIGCHVITVTDDILKKIPSIGYDLDTFSLDTVKMFYRDAVDAGYKI
jgi:transaldolase